MEKTVQQMFDEDDDLIAIQILETHDRVLVVKSTLETMQTDEVIGGKTYLRSVDYRPPSRVVN